MYPLRASMVAIFALLFLVITVSPGSVPQRRGPAGPCSCDDRTDLLNRLNEADRAILEYQIQIQVMLAQEKQTGEPLILTPEMYNEKLQPRIQEAINRVTDANARKARAKTGGFFCRTTVDAPTSCLAEVVSRHERVHQKWCRERGVLNDIRLVDVALEEIEAYSVERNHILSLLRAWPCKPRGWFGTVTYGVINKFSSEETFPPRKTGTMRGDYYDGGKETQERETSYEGTIRVIDNAPTTTQTLQYSYEKNHNNSGKGHCLPKKGYYATRFSDKLTSQAGDTLTKRTPDFSIHTNTPSPGQADVVFRLLTHRTKVKKTYERDNLDSCGKNDKSSNTGDFQQDFSHNGFIVLRGKLSPDGLSFSGSESRPLSPEINHQQGNIKTSSSQVVTASWSLHRSSP